MEVHARQVEAEGKVIKEQGTPIRHTICFLSAVSYEYQ